MTLRRQEKLGCCDSPASISHHACAIHVAFIHLHPPTLPSTAPHSKCAAVHTHSSRHPQTEEKERPRGAAVTTRMAFTTGECLSRLPLQSAPLSHPPFSSAPCRQPIPASEARAEKCTAKGRPPCPAMAREWRQHGAWPRGIRANRKECRVANTVPGASA